MTKMQWLRMALFLIGTIGGLYWLMSFPEL